MLKQQQVLSADVYPLFFYLQQGHNLTHWQYQHNQPSQTAMDRQSSQPQLGSCRASDRDHDCTLHQQGSPRRLPGYRHRKQGSHLHSCL